MSQWLRALACSSREPWGQVQFSATKDSLQLSESPVPSLLASVGLCTHVHIPTQRNTYVHITKRVFFFKDEIDEQVHDLDHLGNIIY